MNSKITRMSVTMLILAVLSAFSFSGCSANNDTTAESTQVLAQVTEPSVKDSDVKVFTVTGINFAFVQDDVENPDIVVNVGDTVRIEFESTDGFHDWVVDEFNAATEKVRPGTPTVVEFVADKAGTFEYYCSVGSHRANGMVGKFIVQ